MFDNLASAIREAFTAPAANDSQPLTCIPHNLDPATTAASDNINALIQEAESPWDITWEQIYAAIADGLAARATH